MIKTIKQFVTGFINIEQEGETLLRERKLDLYNKNVDDLNKFSIDDIVFANKKYEPLSMLTEMNIKENQGIEVIKRHLYKISAYSHKRYGTIWACYVSFPNPSKSYRTIKECFIVTKLNDELKIIVDLVSESDTKKWRHVGGDEDKSLRLHALGKPIQVERYLEPNDDEWSVAFYKKDK